MGRNKKQDSLMSIIRVRISDDMKKQIEQYSCEYGINTSEYVRRRLQEAIDKEKFLTKPIKNRVTIVSDCKTTLIE